MIIFKGFGNKNNKNLKMAKREIKTDLWVYNLLKEANIELDPQGSSIKEIDKALKTASKKELGRLVFLNMLELWNLLIMKNF